MYLDEATHRLAIGGHYVLLVRMHDAIALRPAQVVLQHSQGTQATSGCRGHAAQVTLYLFHAT